MPGAQCTRSLVCESSGWNAHEYSQRVHRKTPGIPTQWFTAYSALSPVIGFLATVAGGKLRRLDASTEASGPHGFAVRKPARSSVAPLASTASNPASVTIAIRPSSGVDGGGYTGDLGFRKTRIFFLMGLDSPNHVDRVQEIRFCAQA
jgi:hypothetical protein